ncbi:acyl-CoA dehydrogenase C-terminal domain-containing protein [Magnetospira thiophila]
MPTYVPPLRDMLFVYWDLFDPDDQPDADLVAAILEQAGKLCTQVLAPLNRQGDEQGCRFDNGSVSTPDGFRAAYRTYVDGGWNGLSCPPEQGGQGLPKALHLLVEEMLCAANLSFSLYPVLTLGAYRALAAHGDAHIREIYLKPLVSGQWTGTMCLTEPQAGSDLGLLRSKAVLRPDGSYAISGSKIFITSGAHDLTENIVHLVLARLPDAPPGTKGISLFCVPQRRVDGAGRLGPTNGVYCAAIEKKMGLHGSATCEMIFEEARGHLVGEPHKGLSAMFTMMNVERLSVGLQGLGIMEASYQNAAAYAKQRLQGRAFGNARHPDKPADPIIVHADVRRMLLTMRSYTEGCRMIAGWVGRQLDIATGHPDPARRAIADETVALLTPMVKALFTDLGSEVASLGVQVYGGHGYIRDHGMEQFERDARIARLYEGTNGIQALDLVLRKLPRDNGAAMERFIHEVRGFLDRHQSTPHLSDVIPPLSESLGLLADSVAWMEARRTAAPDDVAAGAVAFLRLFGLVAMAYQWARAMDVAASRAATSDFHQTKQTVGRFFFARLLPQTLGLARAIRAGAATIMALPDDDV